MSQVRALHGPPTATKSDYYTLLPFSLFTLLIVMVNALAGRIVVCPPPKYGELSERFKEPVPKTGDSERNLGFESLTLRHGGTTAEPLSLSFFLMRRQAAS